MSITLTKGRLKYCKDSEGGISEIWLIPFVDYIKYQIKITDNILTQIPDSLAYYFGSNGLTNCINSQKTNDGGKYTEQSLSITLITTNEIGIVNNLLKRDYRILIKDKNGIWMVLGLYNGISVDKITQVSGGGKTDLNGFTVDFNGQEEDGVFFMTNPFSVGFIQFDTGLYFNYDLNFNF